MIKEFTYPLPDELFVEGVSGNVVGTYTYDGPEKFDVEIDNLGNVLDIDVQNDPENGSDFRKTVDASKNPEVAYLLGHYFVDVVNYEYQFQDEVLENGDVYKKILNPNLGDAYYPKYNLSSNKWELVLIVKDQSNPAALEAKRRKEYVESYSSKYSFGSDVDLLIENYINELDEFILQNPPLKTWKYTNFNSKSVPKIPHSIAIELAKIPENGV